MKPFSFFTLAVGRFLSEVRGSAKAIDVSKLIHDQSWLIRSLGKFEIFVEAELKSIRQRPVVN